MKKDIWNDEVMKIIYGADFVAKQRQFEKSEYNDAICCAKKTIRYFKNNNIKDGLIYIQKIADSSDKINFSDEKQEVYNARIIIEKVRRSLYKRRKIPGKCLEASMAYAAVLAKLGFKFDLIVGQHLFLSNKYRFHAWIEVDQQCVNDKRYSNTDITKIVFKRRFE